MVTRPTVDFWFDFVSGYSWLAIADAAEFAAANRMEWRLRPFALGPVLEQRGRRAIAQVPQTREYAIFDVARGAHARGLRMLGPPRHPFLSLRALRAQVLHEDSSAALPLARELFAAAWERAADLTDPAVVAGCVAAVGLPTDDLDERIRAPETKARLRANTDAALAAGVFGAPFFVYEGEPFWGQDRLPDLAARLAGTPGLPEAERRRVLATLGSPKAP